MKRQILFLFVLLNVVPVAGAYGSFVISPDPACSGVTSGANGTNTANAFTNPSYQDPAETVIYFDDQQAGNNSLLLTVFISDGQYVSGIDEVTRPAFGSGGTWYQWVNFTAYSTATDTNSTLRINWTAQSWTQTATSAHFGITAATWGRTGNGSIPPTTGYHYLNVHSTKILNGNFLLRNYNVCPTYNGYYRGQSLNSTTRMLLPYFLNTTSAAPPAAPILTLTSTNNGQAAILSWSSVGGAAGYVLTESGAFNYQYFYNATVLSAQVNLVPSQTCFTVRASNTAESNQVCANATRLNLAQSIIGNDGGAGLSQGLFGTPGLVTTALFVWGLVLVLMLALTLGVMFGASAGMIGGFVGIVADFAFGWWPLWMLFFIIVVGGGGLLAYLTMARRGRGVQ